MRNYRDFLDLLNRADIIDSSYPAGKCYIWKPRGIIYRRYITNLWREILEDAGFKEYLFPRFGIASNIKKVSNEIKDFTKKMYWLSDNSGKELLYYLNPTGETIIYPVFKNWIKNESILPFKMYQIGSTFRRHKIGNPIINSDEFTTLLDAHVAYSSNENAVKDFQNIQSIMKNIFRRMGLAVLSVERPSFGNNPVFQKCISYETILPTHSRSLAAGVSYYESQIFSKVFKIIFLRNDKSKDFTYQSNFGMSERSMMCELQTHFDKNGLQMMPEFAPEQIVIIPFFGPKNKDLVIDYAKDVQHQLDNFRIILDLSNEYPPRKLVLWRSKGTPIRLGIDENNFKANTVRLIRRIDDAGYDVRRESLSLEITKALKIISSQLYDKSSSYLSSCIIDAESKEQLSTNLIGGKISRFGWCGKLVCMNNLEREFPGEMLGTRNEKINLKKCLYCGKKSMRIAYFSKRCSSP